MGEVVSIYVNVTKDAKRAQVVDTSRMVIVLVGE
jgi:hypothetical protein